MPAYEDFLKMAPCQVADACGAFYERKHVWDPLVALRAGHVGVEYLDFVKMIKGESHALRAVAKRLCDAVAAVRPGHVGPRAAFSGIPTGGYTLAVSMREFFPEKRFVGVQSRNVVGEGHKQFCLRPESVLRAGDQIVLVEDVCNTFGTAIRVIKMLEQYDDVKVVAIACFLNRSRETDFLNYYGRKIPVVSLWRRPMERYRRTDQRVRGWIEAGVPVIEDPKAAWELLIACMSGAARAVPSAAA